MKVELQRKLESEEDSAYKKIAEAEFGVNSSPAWQHVFKGLEKQTKEQEKPISTVFWKQRLF